jgi:hypothetical protein
MTRPLGPVTYRQDIHEPNQEAGYIHAYLLVTPDGPVVQLDIDDLGHPIYLDPRMPRC